MSSISTPTMNSGSLKHRVFTASAWSLGGHGLGLAIRFCSNLIMTRLLLPEMFGVMAIASIVMVGLVMFSDLGINQNVIQSKRGSEPVFLNTAWVVQIFRGFVLSAFGVSVALGIYLGARYGFIPADSVYAAPALPPAIAMLSLGLCVWGFSSTKLAEASRNVAISKVVKLEVTSQLVGLATMLVWASIDRSIWVLVAGSMMAGITQVILSHLWLPGTPNRWQFDRAAFHEIYHFGKWIFASSILGFLVANGDRLLLGGMVDSSVLGVYAIAFLMFNAVEQVLIRVIAGVGFPALSEVVREKRDLKAAYYKFHAVVGAIAYFSAGALMVAGGSIITLLYDPRYAQAGWMLQLLAVALMSVPFHISVQSYLALGKPRYLSIVLTVRLVALAVLTPLGFHFFGLPGAVAMIAAAQLSYVPFIVYINRRFGLFDGLRELYALAFIPIGAAAGMLFTWVVGSL